MSNIYFISDLHLSHKNVIKFHDGFRAKTMDVSTIEEHDEKILDLWNDKIRKRDTVYVLGDIGNHELLRGLSGYKKLILGNHDRFTASEYLQVVDDIIGPIKHKGFWLTHVPPHQQELWGKKVIHGHTHSTGIAHPDYINVSIEMTGGDSIPFESIKSGEFYTHDKVNKTYEEYVKVPNKYKEYWESL